jgi:hypothetical protein
VVPRIVRPLRVGWLITVSLPEGFTPGYAISPLRGGSIEQARQCFNRSCGRVVEVTTGLSDAQWRFEPAPNRWSIAEIPEHMVIVHERVIGRVREQLSQAPAPPADRDYHKLDAVVIEKIPDRSIKGRAPDFIQPTGQLSLLGAWRPPAT